MNKKTGELCCLLENGISNNNERELLAQSFFYYCCGKDPTPIVHFGSDYPLYIYSDTLPGVSFENEIEMLHKRLHNKGYVLIEKESFTKWKNLENVSLSLWATSDNNYFSLIYVQNDAEETFRRIYSDKENYIQPRCICNYRYEGSFPFLQQIEKRAEYVFGYCSNDSKYKSIAEYDYYGDYERNTKVKLYRRRFWYVY